MQSDIFFFFGPVLGFYFKGNINHTLTQRSQESLIISVAQPVIKKIQL